MSIACASKIVVPGNGVALTRAQVEINDYVDWSRRMDQNDLENIPAFWVTGFLFVMIDPALWAATALQKERLDPCHLLVAQPEKIAHRTLL